MPELPAGHVLPWPQAQVRSTGTEEFHLLPDWPGLGGSSAGLMHSSDNCHIALPSCRSLRNSAPVVFGWAIGFVANGPVLLDLPALGASSLMLPPT